MTEHALTSLAGILTLGIGAQWLAWRLRAPAILLLLTAGIIAGPVTGFLNPRALLGDLLAPIISLSVAVILFEGGLRLRIAELTHVGGTVRNLVTVGVLVTWLTSILAGHYLLHLGFGIAALLGAILVVSGPTVIGPVLRHVRPTGKVGPVLRWESILIDPLGAILSVLVFDAIFAGEIQQATARAALLFLKMVLAGAVVGTIGAAFLVYTIRRYWIPDFLQNVVSLAIVVGIYTASNMIQSDSGLLTVVVMGIAMANQKSVTVKHILDFKEHLSILLVSTLFILVGAELQVSDLKYIGIRSLIFLGILLLVSRPVGVALSTLRTGLSWQERLYLGWMAPRGIVAASIAPVFALRLQHTGVRQAEQLVPFTFLVVIGTVIVYGLSAAPLAHVLKLAAPNPQGLLIVGAQPWARAMARAVQDLHFPVLMVDTNRRNINESRLAGLKSHYGSILSDEVTDTIAIEGIGKMLALTSNDEVNSLAALHFVDVFGRENVFQIHLQHAEKSRRQTVPEHLRGRLLFGSKVTYGFLDEQFRKGAVIKATNLTQQYDYKAFQEQYRNLALPLFLIDETGSLLVFTADQPPTPRPGHCLISLTPGEGR